MGEMGREVPPQLAPEDTWQSLAGAVFEVQDTPRVKAWAGEGHWQEVTFKNVDVHFVERTSGSWVGRSAGALWVSGRWGPRPEWPGEGLGRLPARAGVVAVAGERGHGGTLTATRRAWKPTGEDAWVSGESLPAKSHPRPRGARCPAVGPCGRHVRGGSPGHLQAVIRMFSTPQAWPLFPSPPPSACGSPVEEGRKQITQGVAVHVIQRPRFPKPSAWNSSARPPRGAWRQGVVGGCLAGSLHTAQVSARLGSVHPCLCFHIAFRSLSRVCSLLVTQLAPCVCAAPHP